MEPGDSARKIDRDERAGECPMWRADDGVWHVNGHAAARAVLRSTDTVQAGLGVRTVEKLPSRIRRPVLYRDGPEHREDRRQTARFFTPRRVEEHYRDIMVRIADEQLATLREVGRADLAELSFNLAIGVAAAVIGLTDSKPGIRQRLESFFPERFGTPGLTTPHGIYWMLRQNVNWLRVYLGDVRPAVRRRRRRRRDDLISHLLDEGCSAAEILGECLTFAAAGMVTTREFIVMAAWHLFTDDELRARYRAAAEPERLAILQEILRLEPVIGSLARRTTAAVELRCGGEVTTVPEGQLIDIHLSAANVDARAVGRSPLTLRPGRDIAEGGGAAVLSFGDGPHKCPGANIAVLEADVLLHRLFAMPELTMDAPPRVSFKPDIASYELRGLMVSFASG